MYLGLSILDLSKIVIYDYRYVCVKPTYGKKATLCYTDTDNFIVHIKSKVIYAEVAEDVETKFDTSNYEADRPLPTDKNRKVIALKKGELGRTK